MPQVETNYFCPMYRLPAIKRYKKGWRVEFYYSKNGELHRHSIRVERERKKFADDKAAELYIQTKICIPLIEQLKNGWSPKSGEPIITSQVEEKVTIRKLLNEYIAYNVSKEEANQLRKSSLTVYVNMVKVLEQSMQRERGEIMRDCPLDEITPLIAKQYILRLSKLNEWSAKTTNNYIKFWRMIYKFAIESGYTDKNPFNKVSLFVGEEKSKRLLTREEKSKIYNYLLRNNLPFLIFTQLVYSEGIRPVEIFRLQARDLDVRELRITLPASKTKNHKVRSILVSDSLRPLFIDYLKKIDFEHIDQTAYLFHKNFLPAKTKEPLSSGYATKEWQIMRKTLQINSDCKLYGLRHTGITDLLNIFSVNTVRMHIGHATNSQTLHYANHDNEVLQKEVARKAPIFGII